jgi:ABC-2 type transport system permease protein
MQLLPKLFREQCFITNLEDEEGNNVVDAVIAHEMAHQWWAHQEIPALMQGGTFLTESFSEYSSLMVMKESSDAIKMREFLKYDMDRYLRGRSGESEKELPLLKVENQGYIHYGKGSVILFALQEMIGSDSVNAALSEFLEAYRYQGPPYPNANDFMGYLRPRVPDSLQYLLTDWIENITLYDFRLKEAKLKEEGDLFSVTVDLEAFKYRADTLGTENKVSLNEWVDIGFYADDEEKDLLEKRRVFINDSNMSYTFGLAKKPLKVAIDPQRIYIERDIKDNVKAL